MPNLGAKLSCLGQKMLYRNLRRPQPAVVCGGLFFTPTAEPRGRSVGVCPTIYADARKWENYTAGCIGTGEFARRFSNSRSPSAYSLLALTK